MKNENSFSLKNNTLLAPSINSIMNTTTGELTSAFSACNDLTPKFNGTAAAGSTVSLFDGGVWLADVIADAQGGWSYTPTEALAHGRHLFSASSTLFDTESNSTLHSGDSNFFDVMTLDYSAQPQPQPAPQPYPQPEPQPEPHSQPTPQPEPQHPGIVAPMIQSAFNEANGALIANYSQSADSTPSLRGVAEAGTTVSIYDNGSKIGETVASQTGTWLFTPVTALSDGEHKFSVTASHFDPVSNQNIELPGNSDYDVYVVATAQLPHGPVDASMVAPQILAIVNDITGQTFHAYDRCDDLTPTFKGTAVAGSTVTLFDGGVWMADTVTDANGHWSYTPEEPLLNGRHQFSANSALIDVETGETLHSGNSNYFDVLTVDHSVQPPVNHEIVYDNVPQPSDHLAPLITPDTHSSQGHGIDLSEHSGASLTLTLDSILHMGDETLSFHNGKPELMVKGHAGDSLNIVDQGDHWSQQGTTNVDNVTYNVYSTGQQNATLLVEDTMHVNINMM